MFSRWNRNAFDRNNEIVSVVSYSAFKAFVQQANVDLIEQKLQYLVHLQECSDGGLVNYLIHGYIPLGKKDHIVFILYDPLSSSMFKLRVDGDVSELPVEKDLFDILQARYSHVPDFKKLTKNILTKNYNSVETPVENRTFVQLCSRLRLVNNGTHTTLTVAEDPKFVDKLKDLMEKANMPFFVVVNEISILFELSNANAEEAGSMQKLVFGSIRKNKALCNFLVNVMSDLRVVLRTYDGEKMENMEWVEMLAYLSGLRNPFVTVQLLPTYVEPEMGMIQHYPEELRAKYFKLLQTKFKGEDVPAELRSKLAAIMEACEERDENDEEELDEIFLPRVFTGPPDIDGGCHPTWDAPFKMKFKPPSLTNCPVKFTDICELYVEHEKKYMIIMVREAKDLSLFMTAYDPRSATEYMLFGGPPSWSLPGISSEEVYFSVYPPTEGKVVSREDAIQHQLDETIEMHTNKKINEPHKKLRLGFAITPRLVISVYNRAPSMTEELLGSCQISISSVLSGTGAHSRQWSTLMSEVYNKAGVPFFTSSGLLSVDLGYTKRAELEAIAQAKEDYADRCKEKAALQKSSRREAAMSMTTTKAPAAAPHRVFTNSLQSVKVMSALSRDGSLASNDEVTQLQILNAKLSNEVKAIKEETEQAVAKKLNNLEKQESDLKKRMNKLELEEAQLMEAKQKQQKESSFSSSSSEPVASTLSTAAPSSSILAGGAKDSTTQLAANIATELTRRMGGRDKLEGGSEAAALAVFRPLHGLVVAFQDPRARIAPPALASIFAALQMEEVDEGHCQRLIEAARATETASAEGDDSASSSSLVQFIYSQSGDLYHDDRRDLFASAVRDPTPKSASTASRSPRVEQRPSEEKKDDDSGAAGSQKTGGGVEAIDWDTYPLPEEGRWQRRIDHKSGRIFYQSQETRTTQWTHPLQPPSSRSRGGRSKRGKGSSRGQERSKDDADAQTESTGAGLSASQPTSAPPSKGAARGPRKSTNGSATARI